MLYLWLIQLSALIQLEDLGAPTKTLIGINTSSQRQIISQEIQCEHTWRKSLWAI